MAHLEFEAPLVELERQIGALKEVADDGDKAIEAQIAELEGRVDQVVQELYHDLTVWQKVQLSRHPNRPYFLDYAQKLFTDWSEIHGDRGFADDRAIVTAFATFEGQPVGVIGHQKGRTTRQKVERNFGMARPEGYRKAMRLMQLCDRRGLPVLTFIDTPGAYPGIGAEERGQAEAIGRSLLTMAKLGVPAIATVIGEGGSGGAMALGLGNAVLMQQFATYSVITPEGCASILWRNAAKASLAADQLKLLATDAKSLGVIDQVIEEPVGGAHRDWELATERLRAALRGQLTQITKVSSPDWETHRYDKFRAMGTTRLF